MLSESHNHTPPSQILTNHQIGSQFIKPTVFLAAKQNSSKVTYQTTKLPHVPNYYKKYFGHKVLCITKYSQLVSAVHSRKSLKNLSFKYDICEKNGFKSFYDSVLLLHDIKVPFKIMRRSIKDIREGKVSILFESNVNVSKFIKNNMNHLKNIEIILGRDIQQLTYDASTFRGLRFLESFSLKFKTEFAKYCGHWDDDIIIFDSKSYHQNPLSFILLLLQKVKLKKLSINLCPYPLAPEAFSYLLLSVEQANIPVWYFKTGMMSKDFVQVANGMDIKGNDVFPLQLTNSSQVVQKIDFLGIHALNYTLEYRGCGFGEWDSAECGSKEYSPPILLEIPELASNNRRILDITFQDDELPANIVNIRPLLQNFVSLEGLYIKAIENELICEKVSDEPEELDWARNLRKALISIVNVEFEYTCKHFNKYKPFPKLMELLKAHCPVLESLNIFHSFSYYHNGHGITSRETNQVSVPCLELTGFETIRELEINSDDWDLTGAVKMFESLKNLTKLRLNICDNSRSFNLNEKEDIFNVLTNLKEFELVIRPDQTNQGGHRFPVHWARYFAKNIARLTNLEVLRVLDSKETEVQFEVFLELAQELSQMRSLQEIEIQSKIVKNPEAIKTEADLIGESIENVESRMIKNLQSIVGRMVSFNENLNLLKIYSFKGMVLDKIFYQKKVK